MTTAKKTDMRIFNSDESRIKCDLELTPTNWWLRSICSGRNYLVAAAYYDGNVDCHNTYYNGVLLSCMI